MNHYTDKDRARAALHEDRTNELISQAEYEARLRDLDDSGHIDVAIALLDVAIALLIALALLYVGWRYLTALP